MSNEFWRNPKIDQMIGDIVNIFQLEGVQLVRLSGLLKREQQVVGDPNLNPEILHSILNKLKNAGVINYQFVTNCPHCKEVSYQIVAIDKSKPKLCDTCQTFYTLIDGTTLMR